MIVANFPYLEEFFFMLPKFYFRFQLVVQDIEGSSYIYNFFSIVVYCQIWLKINVHPKKKKKKLAQFFFWVVATLSTLQKLRVESNMVWMEFSEFKKYNLSEERKN
jgi:hypothetical protein